MQLTVDNQVGVLRMNTGKANAISARFLESFDASLREAEGSCRALVITGYERFFSAGLALPELWPLDRATMKHFMDRFSKTMLRLFDLRVPVVACINGHAIAGGCVIALQCDYRMMARGPCKIGLSEVSLAIGLPAVVIETMRSQLPPASCFAVAQEGQLSDADTALKLGLVHEAVDEARLLPRALEKATALAALPPGAFAQIKHGLRAEAVHNIETRGPELADQWLDLWFSPTGRAHVEKAVERLSRKA